MADECHNISFSHCFRADAHVDGVRFQCKAKMRGQVIRKHRRREPRHARGARCMPKSVPRKVPRKAPRMGPSRVPRSVPGNGPRSTPSMVSSMVPRKVPRNAVPEEYHKTCPVHVPPC